MINRTTSNFWKCYEALPEDIRELADKNYELLTINPTHPSLQFKKLVGKRIVWAVRVGDHYRALGREREDSILVWFWIGTHEEYNKLIKRV
ncbi:hypothetical protein GO755_09330 [Spirosoma sp. HMF4905]|uniref:ParE-like toxin domain-containing protein n=1 Tax=Spirosoma arboris TaxID=2682092 RepID=A0A7K1S902_9BACT|nr:hypothetical protein [Spirosoma arboris]MVM30235.1 hypothetical protein [Spirosoma arboris]